MDMRKLLRILFRSRHPSSRFWQAERDVGPVAVFLCSARSRYMTGQTLVADGGRYTAL
jgi:NAD(P)-dependent dehydrogenase (short-subunit alcohol dehydrogenase family)